MNGFSHRLIFWVIQSLLVMNTYPSQTTTSHRHYFLGFTEAIVREENPRTLATEMSKQVVYRAMLLRKGAINVAREAFERRDKISV